MKALTLLLLVPAIVAVPTANVNSTTYTGIYQSDIEVFLGIRFAHDTAGANRFKPPIPYVPKAGSVINATNPGPDCPQQLGQQGAPLYIQNVTEISEDCLRLNVYRPNGTTTGSKYPVIVYIYGGSFIESSKDEPFTQPGGIIVESTKIDRPIMYVAMNYRLGPFGFAQTDALRQEGSENAGLRDQRLALEWVQQNIAAFGGDPDQVSIQGQSSGGLSVGMQTLAYGGRKPAVFHQIIAESGLLEDGIIENYTRDATRRVVKAVGCNQTGIQSAATVACLRNLTMDELLNAEFNTYKGSARANEGDIWLPAVDGDFLPAAPNDLISKGKFYNVNAIIGWCQNDALIFPDNLYANATKVERFFQRYLPHFSESEVKHLLSLYPKSEFHTTYEPNGTVEIPAEGYRQGRILTDVFMVCQGFYFGGALLNAGNDVYYYNVNQSILPPILASEGAPGYGPVHTSEFAYVFGNLSHYDVDGFPYDPRKEDYTLARKASRSFASFAALGHPSVKHKGTLEGWRKGNNSDENFGVYMLGGPTAGYSGPGGRDVSREAIATHQWKKRCGYLLQPDLIVKEGW